MRASCEWPAIILENHRHARWDINCAPVLGKLRGPVSHYFLPLSHRSSVLHALASTSVTTPFYELNCMSILRPHFPSISHYLSPTPIRPQRSPSQPPSADPCVYLLPGCKLFSQCFLWQCRFLESQLILTGKGYGLVYSIWGRFRDIIGEGSGLVTMNPSLLSARQVQH